VVVSSQSRRRPAKRPKLMKSRPERRNEARTKIRRCDGMGNRVSPCWTRVKRAQQLVSAIVWEVRLSPRRTRRGLAPSGRAARAGPCGMAISVCHFAPPLRHVYTRLTTRSDISVSETAMRPNPIPCRARARPPPRRFGRPAPPPCPIGTSSLCPITAVITKGLAPDPLMAVMT
jgi:hypothetical protein